MRNNGNMLNVRNTINTNSIVVITQWRKVDNLIFLLSLTCFCYSSVFMAPCNV